MATQRYISTSFWDDPWVTTLNKDEKLLYLYFLTNPLTHIAGIYQISIRRMVFDTGIDEQEIKNILIKFEKDKKAYYYRDELIILPKWPAHQKWKEKKKIETGIVAYLETLSPETLGYLKKISYTYPIDKLSVPYAYEPNYSDINIDSDINKDRDKDTDTAKPFFPEEQQRYNYKDTDVDRFIEYANKTGAFPRERRLTINLPNPGEIRNIFSYFSEPEILSAFDNYKIISSDADVYEITKFKSLLNFILKDGLNKFTDEAKPYEQYARGQPTDIATDEDIQTDFSTEVF